MLNIIQNTIGALARKGLSVIRNGLKMWLPFEKSEILGEDINEGYDFTSGWNEIDITGKTANTFTSDPDGGLYKTLVEAGKTYSLTIEGTTDSVGVQVRNANDSELYYDSGATGVFSDTVIFVPTQTNVYIKNKSAGDATITTFKIQEVTQIAPDKSSNSNSAKLFTGKALSFDGVNDYVDLGSDVNSNGTVWTTAIWISNYTPSTFDFIYGDDYSKNIGLNNGIGTTGNVFYKSVDNTYNEFSCEVFKSSFTDAKRLVFTSDGTDISLYIDGELIDSVTPSTTNLKLSRLMAGYSTSSHLVDATASDFQIYDTAWTQADVTFDYNNPQHLVTDNSELRYGSELVVNGDFAQGSQDWTVTGSDSTHYVEFLSEGARFVSDTTSTVLQLKQNVITPGKSYVATCDITYTGAGAIRLNVGTNLAPLSEGANTEYFIAASNSFSFLRDAENVDCVISNVTVKEIVSPTLNNLKGYWHLSEGDGSIVYDSSGEGNDGTINGATWEDQQATIPQLGLMDWSKGSNVLTQSNGFNASPWVASDISLTYGETAPDGTATAYKVTQTGGSGTGILYDSSVASNIGVIRSIWAKTVSGTGDVHLTSQNGNSNSLFTVTNQWQRFSVASGSSAAGNFYAVDFRGSSTLTEVIIWGAQEEVNTTDPLSAYRLTNGTAVTDATLISDPNDPSEDILGNSVRLREHSLNLDGSGYAEVPDADDLDFGTGDFSLECWVKYDFFNQGSGWNVIMSNGSMSASGGSGFNLGTYSSAFAIRLNDGSVATEYIGSSLTEGQWYHIVITRDGTSLKTYLDTSESTYTIAAIDVTTSQDIRIGRDTNSNRYYQDLIDDVRIYNRALSSDEVEQNHKAGLNKHKASSSFSDDFSSDYGF